MTLKISHLEVLALAELAPENRTKRMAAYCLKHGRMINTLLDAKEVIEAFSEPRGRKVVLRKELLKEYKRQDSRRRARATRRRISADVAMDAEKYDPVTRKAFFGRPGLPGKGTRIAGLVASRMHADLMKDRERGRAWKPEKDPDGGQILVSNQVSWAHWCGKSNDSNITDTAMLPGGVLLMLYRPNVIYLRGVKHYEHNHRYLFVKEGDLPTVSYRVKSTSWSMQEALESLKPSTVRKAIDRGDIVQHDWQRGLFLVRSPKRKKWREIPFKRHTRDRKPKVEQAE